MATVARAEVRVLAQGRAPLALTVPQGGMRLPLFISQFWRKQYIFDPFPTLISLDCLLMVVVLFQAKDLDNTMTVDTCKIMWLQAKP